MYYFRFEIPRHPDGTIAIYPPGWFGTMDKCPADVTVLLLNDKEAWGIAKSDDAFVPPEVTVISEAVALDLLSETQQEDKVFSGQTKVYERWAKEESDHLERVRQRLIDEAVEKVLDG